MFLYKSKKKYKKYKSDLLTKKCYSLPFKDIQTVYCNSINSQKTHKKYHEKRNSSNFIKSPAQILVFIMKSFNNPSSSLWCLVSRPALQLHHFFSENFTALHSQKGYITFNPFFFFKIINFSNYFYKYFVNFYLIF